VVIERFGAQHLYTADGVGPISVTGVFENPTRQSQVGQRPVSAKFPAIYVLKTEVPNLRKGDLFEIDGDEYRVKEPGTDEGEVVSAKLERLK